MDPIHDVDRKDDRNDDRNDGISVDAYKVHRQDMEVDSDLNEDRNREQQLDDSFQDWYRNIEYWVQ